MDYLKHRITKVCLIAGFVITGILLWQIGFQNVEHHIALIGLGIFPIFFVSVLWKHNNTIAWAIVFTPDTSENHPGFRKLLVANLAGDVINNMVPTAGVGGELIKPYFLKSWISVSQSFSAVLLNKVCEILSGIVFTALSLFMALMVLPLPGPVRMVLVVGMGGIGFALAAFFSRHSRNLFLGLYRWGCRIPILGKSLGTKADLVHQVNTNLALFRGRFKWRFFGCLILHLISWCLGTYETFLILHFMGVHTTLTIALFLAVLPMINDLIFFFMPNNIGTSEAGHTYISAGLGLNPAVGFALSLMKRIRKLLWMAIGTLLLYTISRWQGVQSKRNLATPFFHHRANRGAAPNKF